jgi:hypothetical protein
VVAVLGAAILDYTAHLLYPMEAAALWPQREDTELTILREAAVDKYSEAQQEILARQSAVLAAMDLLILSRA